MGKKTILVVGFCSFFLASCLCFATNVLSQNRSSVMLFLVPELTREDVREAYDSQRFPFLKQAALGELNIRSALSLKDIHNVLTISAGTRAAGSEWGRHAYGIHGRNGEGIALYRQYTGEIPPTLRNGSVLFPYMAVLRRSNEQKNTGAVPGLVGETLERHGISRAVIGNSDTNSQISRLAALITMNQKGVTPEGWVGEETLIRHAFFPGERKTDYSFMYYHMARWKARGVGLIVAELGDLRRLGKYESVLDTERYALLRKQIVHEMIGFVGKLVAEAEPRQRLLLVSASLPDSEIVAKKRMASVLLWEAGRYGGVITSGTTRQPGIAANIDIAPSVLSWLGIQLPPEMKGLPLRVDRSRSVSHDSFWRTAELVDAIYATRPFVLYPYIVFSIIVILVVPASLFLRGKAEEIKRKATPALQCCLLFVLLMPCLLLFLSALPYLPSPLLTVLLLGGVGSCLAYILRKTSFGLCFLCVGLAGWLPVLADGLLGGELIRRSYLGYDPVIGARYYGIGNEYMGVMLGSVVLSLAMWGELRGKQRRGFLIATMLVLFAILILYMAWPAGGSKAGGILVFLAALVYGVFAFSGCSMRIWRVVLVVTIGLAAACLVFWLNYQFAAQEQSHIGRAVGELLGGNWAEIGRIIERKVTMNWRLILTSIWSKLFIAGLTVSLLLLYWKREKVKQLASPSSFFIAGVKTIAFGSFVALFTNDSGIIAAALAMLYALVPILYVLLRNENTVD
ncbi:hypothetical protein [Aneurinibacillus thermoaerophilus]|uniref:hypothetical protein n=1 Tax=Aneurinibacillus thermoaerophilus TaxID=143495 RepID=UPI002E218D2A|nr:hypothetical protein [Aneurinibacillus thermoaerophilus]